LAIEEKTLRNAVDIEVGAGFAAGI